MLQNNSKMKTKLIAMQWRGSASVDPRFSSAMLPWSIADIYSRDQFLNVSSDVIKCEFFCYLINKYIKIWNAIRGFLLRAASLCACMSKCKRWCVSVPAMHLTMWKLLYMRAEVLDLRRNLYQLAMRAITGYITSLSALLCLLSDAFNVFVVFILSFG